MAYKKPQIIAKSEPKQVYVAGCPTHNVYTGCAMNYKCQCFPLQ